MSSCRAIRETTPCRSPCCSIAVRTSWIARSFTSGGYRLDEGWCLVAMVLPPFPRQEVSMKPRAVQKVRLLELAAGAERRIGYRNPVRIFATPAQHRAEREVGAQAEKAYR